MLTKDELMLLLELHGETNGGSVPATLDRLPSDWGCDAAASLVGCGYVEAYDPEATPISELNITDAGIDALKEALAEAALTDTRHTRPEICRDAIRAALNAVDAALWAELTKKGYGSFASTHEIDGVIEEEFNELKAAIHGNRPKEEIVAELIDIAVPAIFGIACIEEGAVDW